MRLFDCDFVVKPRDVANVPRVPQRLDVSTGNKSARFQKLFEVRIGLPNNSHLFRHVTTSVCIQRRLVSTVGVQLLNLGFGETGFAGLFLADVPDPRLGIAVNAGENLLVRGNVLGLPSLSL